jgi:hypothetical protein
LYSYLYVAVKRFHMGPPVRNKPMFGLSNSGIDTLTNNSKVSSGG